MDLAPVFNRLARYNWQNGPHAGRGVYTAWDQMDLRRDDTRDFINTYNDDIKALLRQAGYREDFDFFTAHGSRFEFPFYRRFDYPYVMVTNEELAEKLLQARDHYLDETEIRPGRYTQAQVRALEELRRFNWRINPQTLESYIDIVPDEDDENAVNALTEACRQAERMLLEASFEPGEHFYFADLMKQDQYKGRPSPGHIATLHIASSYEWLNLAPH